MTEKISREAEFNYLLRFMTDCCFTDKRECELLRILWTAYCFHHNLPVDTAKYDSDLLQVWNKLLTSTKIQSIWRRYDRFEDYMCKYLV